MTLKILVVDDSALMRRYLRQVFEAEGDMDVRLARDGEDALAQIKAFDPDVVTLDINMPVMDGLTCLNHIMTDWPRPVIMLSSLTEKGALATFEALELGAVDFVAKPGGTVSHNIAEVFPELVAKVRAAVPSVRRRRTGSIRRSRPVPKAAAAPRRAAAVPRRSRATSGSAAGLVVVGSSTGGPRALSEMLPKLPANFPFPVLIAQHMPANFTGVFAERLNGECALEVSEVAGPSLLEPGRILIARGDADTVVITRGGKRAAISVPAKEEFIWHPSVERMVRSALEHYQAPELIAVQLTGMGNDGAAAMAEVHAGGGRTIAESEATAAVYGMPRELVERNGADKVLPIDRITAQLIDWSFEKPRRANRLSA